MVAFSELTLVKATPEQAVEASRRSFVQWSRGMKMEEYLERDKVMSLHEHARDGKLIAWYIMNLTQVYCRPDFSLGY
jgi:hypothetical protein